MLNKIKTIRVFFLLFIAIMVLTSCGGKSGSSNQPLSEQESVSLQESAAISEVSDQGTPNAPPENKIILSANINMETDRFDEAVNQLRLIVVQKEGYIENANLETDYTQYSKKGEAFRQFRITIKIPQAQYADTKKIIETIGHVLNSQESAEDVTQQYYDMESRLKTKKIEEERLLLLIENAVETKDLLELEKRLADVRQSIKMFETDIRSMDRRTTYSTIEVSLREVKEAGLNQSFRTLPSKMKSSFYHSIDMILSIAETIASVIAALIVPVGLIGIPCFTGICVVRRINKKQKKEPK